MGDLPFCILRQFRTLIEQGALPRTRRGLDKKRGSFAGIILCPFHTLQETTQYFFTSVEVLRFAPVIYTGSGVYEVNHDA